MKYKLKAKNKSPKEHRDILLIKEWPNKVLVKRYEQVKEKAIETEKRLEELSLYEQEKKEQLADKYRAILRLIELLEDEGREREILYFMPWKEVREICERLFSDKRKFKLVSKGVRPQA